MSGGPTLHDDQGVASAPPPVESASLARSLAPHGLHLRGDVEFSEGEGPLLADGAPARALVLVGPAGGSLWPAFSTWLGEAGHANLPDPLDHWSREVVNPVAREAGASAFYPSDRPWQPFQRWAMRAEGLQASPLGMLIHPLYGLWHGYRAALAFARPVSGMAAAPSPGIHPCDSCADKPCLTSCPAAAIGPEGFRYEPCRRFLGGAEGSLCLDGGCRARDACPVGREFRYPAEQIRFHMAALKLL